MKKQITFFKTLLAAALLGVGANAWAEVTPYSEAYSAGSTATGWKSKTSGRFTPVILSEEDNYYLSVTQGERNNNGTTVTGEVLAGKAEAGDDFTLSFDMRLSNSNNQSPVSLEIKDAANSGIIFSLTATGKNATTWKINGTENIVTLPNSGAGMAVTDITWISYKISRSGSLTYITITNKETGDEIFERQTVDGASATGGLGNIVFTTRRYNANFAIDNIELRELQSGDVPAVTPVNYTIKYKDESDNTIKDDIVKTSFVGAEVTASADEVAPVYSNDKKYLYKSGNETITLVAEEASNVITLVYREAATYKYTINATDGSGNLIEVLASGSAYEADAVKAAYPVYVNNNGTLYTKDATDKSFQTTFTLSEDDYVLNYTYKASDITNVAFYTEGEKIEGATVFAAGNADARSSNAAVGYATESDLAITTLTPGEYRVHGVGFFPSGAGGTITITDGTNNLLVISGKSANSLPKDSTFTIGDNTTVYLAAGGNENSALDYVYFVRTSDDAVSFTLGADESVSYKSYVTKNATNFTDNGLEAYVATASTDTKATLKKIEKAPAGTPVILKGTKGQTTAINFSDEEIEAPAVNLLKASTGTAISASESKYVLAFNDSNWEFCHFEGTLSAGKVYLDVPASAKSLEIVFEGQTTGINDASRLNAETTKENIVFNLNGQRIAAPQKGINIINGRKVIVK